MNRSFDRLVGCYVNATSTDPAKQETLRQRLGEVFDSTLHSLVSSGETAEEAESDIVSALHPPISFLWKTGFSRPAVWYWLEKFCCGLAFAVMAFSFPGLISTLGPLREALGLAGFLAIVLASLAFIYIRERVDLVGERLRIGRTLLPAVQIPPSSISAVRWNKGTFWSREHLLVEFEGGKWTIGSKMTGFYPALMALSVLAPDKFDQASLSLLESVPIKVRKRKAFWDRFLLVMWSILFLFLATGWWQAWTLKGLSLPIIATLLLTPILVVGNCNWCGHLLKRSLYWLLLAASYVAIMVVLVTVIAGNLVVFRFFMIMVIPFVLLPPLILVWKGKGSALVLISVVAMSAALMAGKTLSPIWEGPSQVWGRSRDFMVALKWLSKTTPTLAVLEKLSSDTSSVSFLTSSGSSVVDLPAEGEWSFVVDYSPEVLTLHRRYESEFRSESGYKKWFSEVYLYPLEGAPAKIDEGTMDTTFGGISLFETPIWSPDRKTLLLAGNVPEGTDTKTVPAFYHIDSGTWTVLGDAPWSLFGKWNSNERYLLVSNNSQYLRPEGATDEVALKAFELDVDTGDWSLFWNHPVKTQESFEVLQGAEYALRFNRELGVLKFSLVELETMKETHLPRLWIPHSEESKDLKKGAGRTDWVRDLFEGRFAWDWDKNLKRLAYVGREGDDRILVVAGPEGVIKQISLDLDGEISAPLLSPDGNRLLFAHHFLTMKDFWLPLGFTLRRVWDLESGTVTTVQALSMMNSLVDFMVSSTSTRGWHRSCWSPDSRYLAVQRGNAMVRGFSCEVVVLDYGGWLERTQLR